MIISRTKRALEMKENTFFLVSQVLSFKHAKEKTSKDVADATFKMNKNAFNFSLKLVSAIF